MAACRPLLACLPVLAVAALTGCAGSAPRDFAEVGSPPAAQADAPRAGQTGLASFYAHHYHGRTTASGEPYDENALTAAHRDLPFGTRIRVTRLDDGRAVTLRVNDRGPFVVGRIVDVSRRAARELDFVAAGLVRVRLEVLD
ncbi:MAG: septal ring lytic transglycosylase RlpA family protein [Candidatus Krumholzibacteriia bacterium]